MNKAVVAILDVERVCAESIVHSPYNLISDMTTLLLQWKVPYFDFPYMVRRLKATENKAPFTVSVHKNLDGCWNTITPSLIPTKTSF